MQALGDIITRCLLVLLSSGLAATHILFSAPQLLVAVCYIHQARGNHPIWLLLLAGLF
jgi:hypothetical protein